MATLWEADLTAGYAFVVGPASVTLQAYVFNLFNNQIETGVDTAWTVEPAEGYPDTLYDPNVPSNNPDYGKVRARQTPRLFRGAIKIAF